MAKSLLEIFKILVPFKDIKPGNSAVAWTAPCWT
jgi:hypothetical protein